MLCTRDALAVRQEQSAGVSPASASTGGSRIRCVAVGPRDIARIASIVDMGGEVSPAAALLTIDPVSYQPASGQRVARLGSTLEYIWPQGQNRRIIPLSLISPQTWSWRRTSCLDITLSTANVGIVAGARIAIDVLCVFGPPLNLATVGPISGPDMSHYSIREQSPRQPVNDRVAQPPDAFSASIATAPHQSKEVTKLSEYNL